MKRLTALIIIAGLSSGILLMGQKKGAEELKSIDEYTQGFKSHKGFLDYYWDGSNGKVYLAVDPSDVEFLMASYLSGGMGSNDVGLDRGKIGTSIVVKFHRAGNKVLLVEPNYAFRADTEDPNERRAVEESFAVSVIWGFEILAGSNSKVLLDITDFLFSDHNHVSSTLKTSGQGQYQTDPSRSAMNLERTRNFPDNTEFDIILTFSGEPRGRYIYQTVPMAAYMTVGQHISFIRLPEPGEYQPRTFHPESGYGYIRYIDLASPLGEPLEKRYIARHRLEKKDPAARVSGVNLL